MDISQSKLKNWRQCRKAYYYKYVMRLTKKFKPMPFLRGDIVHQMLEAHYKGKDPWPVYRGLIKENEKPLRIHREEYGNLEHDLKVLMKGYFSFYKKETLKPLVVEHEFRLPLTKGIFLNGKIDLIAIDQRLRWMAEHKCHNKIPNGSIVPYGNLQSNLYLWAYNKENPKKPLHGVMWNYLLGKPLPVPQLLKNGTMSRKKTNTTWPVYRQALIDNGLDPEDYFDVRDELKGNELSVYQRHYIPVDKSMVDTLVEESKVTALEIQKLAGKDQTRNLGRHCDYCEFKNLCLTQLKGLDVNYILKHDFKERKKDEKPKEYQQED